MSNLLSVVFHTVLIEVQSKPYFQNKEGIQNTTFLRTMLKAACLDIGILASDYENTPRQAIMLKLRFENKACDNENAIRQ